MADENSRLPEKNLIRQAHLWSYGLRVRHLELRSYFAIKILPVNVYVKSHSWSSQNSFNFKEEKRLTNKI